MSEHDAIRELLPLAAADALEEREMRRVEEHLRLCPACSAEWDSWRALERGLKQLPTPQAPGALVERTRLRMQAQLAVERERTWSPWLVGFLVLLSWTLAVATWPVVRFLKAGVLSWLDLGFRHAWSGVVAYTLAGWVVGGVGAAILGWRRVTSRRAA